MLNKQQYAAHIVKGDQVDDVFLLAQARQAQAKNGPFWALTLQDVSGQVAAKVWSPLSQRFTSLEGGAFLRVTGKAGEFREQIDLNVDALEVLDLKADEVDLAEFLPTSAEKPADMLARLKELARATLRFPPWRTLALGVLEDKEAARRLQAAPGGKAIHHAYVGGLLEHTLSVAGLCMKLCDHYPELDREILLVAAILHDLGKAWELCLNPAPDYTDEGRLMGHIILGLQVIEPRLAACGAGEALLTHLKHILVSHHGEYEYGSPRRPKTAEAMALHYADNIDAKMNQFQGLFAQNGGSDEAEEGVWSPYQRSLERYCYKPAATPGQGAEGPNGDDSPKEEQCSLLSKV